MGGLNEQNERTNFIYLNVFYPWLFSQIFYRKLRGVSKMLDWIIKQITDFNVLMLFVFFIFSTVLSKANMQKQLKEQSQELYNELEEIKDEIRGNTRRTK